MGFSNCKKHSLLLVVFSLSMQVMYKAWCRVIDVIAKFPASCYDSSIKSQLSENLPNNSPILNQAKTQESQHNIVALPEQQICEVLASLKISVFLCRKQKDHLTRLQGSPRQIFFQVD